MISFRITRKDLVDSTNDRIKALISEGAPEGAVVIAKRQRSGYGRRGHAWQSPEGGLYMSVLLRPAAHLDEQDARAIALRVPTLSLLAGMAVRRGICALLASEAADIIKVKWPNDVLAAQGDSFAKLCGISLEGSPEGVCLGVGVNVIPPEEGAQPGCAYGRDLPGGEDLDVDEVASSVLDAFGHLYEKWLTQPFTAFLDEYNSVNALAGRIVSVRCGDELIEGAFVGADGEGRMLVRQSDGTVRTIVSGEAHIESLA